MKLIIFLLLSLLAFTVSGALTKCDDNAAQPVIQIGGTSPTPTTLADGSAIDSFNDLVTCISQLTGTGSDNSITKLTINSSIDLTEDGTYNPIVIQNKFSTGAGFFDLEANFTNNAMNMDDFYTKFMAPFQFKGISNLNQITFSTDQEISWETLKFLKVWSQSNQLGASTFNYLTQTYTGITDMTSLAGLAKVIDTDALFTACVKEWAIYSEVTLKTVTPGDFETCASLLNQTDGFMTKLTIDLEGATGGLTSSQINFSVLFSNVRSNLVELDMNIKSCQIQQAPYITQNNFLSLRKLKLNVANNDYQTSDSFSFKSKIEDMTEIELLEFELIFQDSEDDTNFFRDFSDLFDIMTDQVSSGTNMDSLRRTLKLYDGFNLCTYNEKGESDCDIFVLQSVNVSNYTPMNCQGETVTVNADGLFTHNGIDLSAETEYSITVNHEYFTWDIINPDQSLTLDMYQVNSCRTFTVDYNGNPLVYKGTETNKKLIPYFDGSSSQYIKVYECAPRAQLLANGVPVQNNDTIEFCNDYEFTIGNINMNGFNPIIIDSNTKFTWSTNQESYIGESQQSLAISQFSQSTSMFISLETENPNISIPKINLEINKCSSTSTILINGGAPAATYTPCTDLTVSLGDIVGNAVQNEKSYIRWFVSADYIPIQGTFSADKSTFTIPASVLEVDKTFKIINIHYYPNIDTEDVEFSVVAGTCEPPAVEVEVEATESSTILQFSLALLIVFATIL